MAAAKDGNFIGAMLSGARSLPAAWWLLVVAITAGTNTLDFLALDLEDRRNPLFLAASATRFFLICWIVYALLRRLAGEARPIRTGLGYHKIIAFMIATILLAGAASLAGITLSGGEASSVAAGLYASFASTLAFLALIRLWVWQAPLANGEGRMGPAALWRGLAGYHARLALAYLIVAAIALLHSLLTRMALVPGTSRGALLGLAALDGLVTAVQLVLGCALAVAAWRIAQRRSGPLREAAALA